MSNSEWIEVSGESFNPEYSRNATFCGILYWYFSPNGRYGMCIHKTENEAKMYDFYILDFPYKKVSKYEYDLSEKPMEKTEILAQCWLSDYCLMLILKTRESFLQQTIHLDHENRTIKWGSKRIYPFIEDDTELFPPGDTARVRVAQEVPLEGRDYLVVISTRQLSHVHIFLVPKFISTLVNMKHLVFHMDDVNVGNCSRQDLRYTTATVRGDRLLLIIRRFAAHSLGSLENGYIAEVELTKLKDYYGQKIRNITYKGKNTIKLEITVDAMRLDEFRYLAREVRCDQGVSVAVLQKETNPWIEDLPVKVYLYNSSNNKFRLAVTTEKKSFDVFLHHPYGLLMQWRVSESGSLVYRILDTKLSRPLTLLQQTLKHFLLTDITPLSEISTLGTGLF